MNPTLKLSALAIASILVASPVVATTTIYSTSFTGFAAPTNFVTNFNIVYGGTAPTMNHTKVGSAVWGITAAGNGFADGVARPSSTGNANHRFTGLFLDPSLFASTGAGTYTISFDITGVVGANTTYNAFVYAGSGYDLSGDTDKRINLALNTANAPISATGEGVVASLLTSRNLSTEATSAATTTVSFDFTYDGTSAIAFAIGGFSNGSVIDNFAVTTTIPEPSSYALLAGVGGLGLAALRRRRRA